MTDLVTSERAARLTRLLPVDMATADVVAYLQDQAERAAALYTLRGSVFVVLEPGDATRYPLLLTDLHRTAGIGGKGQQLMPQVGGELSVQVFEHPLHLQSPLAIGLPLYLLPQDVAEHIGCSNGHTACVLAGFLVAFSDALQDLR